MIKTVFTNKKYFLLLLVWPFTILQINAQNNPTSQTQVGGYTGTVGNQSIYKNNNTGHYDISSLVNYTKTWMPKIPVTDPSVVSQSTDVTQIDRIIQYSDGLGRSIQTISWQSSPNKTDVVVPDYYDNLGRQPYQFMPYVSNASDGGLKTDPFSDQYNFYTQTYNSQQPAINGEQFFYSKVGYESSPLNRVIKSFSPGNNYVGSEGGSNEHAVNTQYLFNNTNDQVKLWTITYNRLTYSNNDVSTNVPVSTTTYNAGQLTKTVVIDVHGHAVVSYTDNEGHLVLKKVQVGNNISSDFSGQDGNWLCTYYVYDYFGLLRFTITPKAYVQYTNSGNQLTPDIVNRLCNRYEYDEKHRLIAQKIAGKGWEYMVYDLRDRLVFYQDAKLLSKGQWLYKLYDDLDRVNQTGIMVYNSSRDNLQLNVNSNWQGQSMAQPVVNGNYASSVPSDLVVDTRVPGNVNNDYKATNSVVIDAGFSSEDGAEIQFRIVDPNTSTFSIAVNSYNNPIPSGATLIPLTLNFYDKYSWTSKTFNGGYSNQLDVGNNSYGDPYPSQPDVLQQGRLTGTRVRVLENPSDLTQGAWLESVSYYDMYGRNIQVQADNYKGGVDILSKRFNFKGGVVSSYLVHNNPTVNVSLGVKTNYNYDFEGRLMDIRKKVIDNNNTSANYPTRIVAAYQYDALGNVLTKSLGGQPELGTSALETLTYNYNISGALKSVNGDYCKTAGSTNHYFGYDLSYDWGFNSNRYDGSIAGMRWKSKGSGNTERAYGFAYDNVDRFLKADFTQRDQSSNWNTSDGVNYTVQMGDGQNGNAAYDENGNIKAMQQYGLMLGGSSLVDNLTYQYDASGLGNQLTNVTDPVSNTGLGDFTKKNTSGTDDYAYDVNGNLMQDLNKKITSINYNYLDLPDIININNDDNTAKSTTIYVYDASGNKLEKRVQIYPSSNNNNSSKTVYTTYLGGFVYKDNVLQFFNHDEGRVRFTIPPVGVNTSNNFVFDYFITDHLTNVRTVLTDEQYNTQNYVATVEPNNLATEVQLFGDEENQTKTTKPPGFDNNGDNTQVTGLVNYGSGSNLSQVVGPGLLLKVMAGDLVNINSQVWYRNQDLSNNNNGLTSALAQVLANLLGSPTTGGIPLTEGATTTQLNNALTAPVSGFLNTNRPLDNTVPKAYINWILLSDEQLKMIPGGSGAKQLPHINAGDQQQPLSQSGITVPANGYLYVFVSNESNTQVYFNDLTVNYTPGPLREENAYYPAGLPMARLSSQAFGAITNNYKYQGSYSEVEEETGYNEFDLRRYDAQLGRWTGIDPQNQYASPYVGMGNSWVNGVDADGGGFLDVLDGWIELASGQAKFDAAANANNFADFGGVRYLGDGNFYDYDKLGNLWYFGYRAEDKYVVLNDVTVIGHIPGTLDKVKNYFNKSGETFIYNIGEVWRRFATSQAQGWSNMKYNLNPYSSSTFYSKLGYLFYDPNTPFTNIAGTGPLGLEMEGLENSINAAKTAGKAVEETEQTLKNTEASIGLTNTIPEGSEANHLFKGNGKLVDNPANRDIIQKMSNGNPIGVDPYGKVWYSGLDANGNPIYSYTQNGIVKGAGYMNMTVEEMITKYNLK